MEQFDIAIVGAGPGGYPAAIRSAQLGAKVALIEMDKVGGTCLNYGCIPTKTLLNASNLIHRLNESKGIGVDAGTAKVDYAKLVAHKDSVVKKLTAGVESLLKANAIHLYAGSASFESRDRINIVNPVTHDTISAKKIVIATGSSAFHPEFLPKHDRVIDSRAFLAMDHLPDSMLILGGGIIGCELACMAAQLGCDVTIVELLDDIMNMLDKDVRREVRRYMEKSLGIRILTGAALENIEANDKGVSATAGDGKLEAGYLLSVIGRIPATASLCLQAAGLTVDDRGYVPVDEYGRTDCASIFAIGDVNGGPQLAHSATSQGIIAAGNALGEPRRKFETVVPNVVFTTPEIGTVGLSVDDAKKNDIDIQTGKFFFRGLGKGVATDETLGFVKWIADPQTGQLLGASVVGAHATELIQQAVIAIRAELTVEELGNTIHSHPTFSEAFMEAAHAIHGKAIHMPPKKKK